jgi:hypothetical protein
VEWCSVVDEAGVSGRRGEFLLYCGGGNGQTLSPIPHTTNLSSKKALFLENFASLQKCIILMCR